MNEFTLLLCIIPIAVGVGLPIAYMTGWIQTAAANHRREEAKEHRADEALAIRQAAALRATQLHESKVAKENNLVVLQDAKLEIELLKLKELQFKTRHMNPGAFVVTDHQPGEDSPPPVSGAKPPAQN